MQPNVNLFIAAVNYSTTSISCLNNQSALINSSVTSVNFVFFFVSITFPRCICYPKLIGFEPFWAFLSIFEHFWAFLSIFEHLGAFRNILEYFNHWSTWFLERCESRVEHGARDSLLTGWFSEHSFKMLLVWLTFDFDGDLVPVSACCCHVLEHWPGHL